MRRQIEAAGGVEALVRDPTRLARAAAGLGVGQQLTLHKVCGGCGGLCGGGLCGVV